MLEPFLSYALNEIFRDLYLGCKAPELTEVLGSLKVDAHCVGSLSHS